MPKYLKRRLLVGLVISVVLCFAVAPWWAQLQGLFKHSLLNFAQVSNALGSSVRSIVRVRQLEQENIDLKLTLAGVKSDVAERAKLAQENAELRASLFFPNKAPLKLIGADVVGEQTDETGVHYLINRGANDGLRVGQAIVLVPPTKDFATSGIIVGTLNFVAEHQSSYILISAPGSRVAAETIKDKPARGLVTGEYNLAMKFSLVPRTSELNSGDTVVTNNANALIPAGLLIGTVASLVSEDGDFFQTAIVAPAIPAERYTRVYVAY